MTVSKLYGMVLSILLVGCGGGDSGSSGGNSGEDEVPIEYREVSFFNATDRASNGSTSPSGDSLIITSISRKNDNGLECSRNGSKLRTNIFSGSLYPGRSIYINEDELKKYCDVSILAFDSSNEPLCATVEEIRFSSGTQGSTRVNLFREDFGNC